MRVALWIAALAIAALPALLFVEARPASPQSESSEPTDRSARRNHEAALALQRPFGCRFTLCSTVALMMDLQRLRIYRAVVAAGSIQGAAANLGYTPSAVSQQVAALSRETGLALIGKAGRGIEPTDAGLELVQAADTLTAEGFATDLVILPKLERTACLWHPSLADHALIAETLTASIRKDLPGWRN